MQNKYTLQVLRAVLAGVVVSSVAFAEGALPAFKNLRYEEDSAAYKEADTCGSKYINLGDSESMFLSLGGQARLRWELWDNFGFVPENDDDFGLVRIRLHGDLHLGENFRAFVELKSSSATDRELPGGNRGLDVDSFDVQNAFLDFKSAFGDVDSVLRVGRQELSYGKQRLVSPLDWSNTRRTWDGGKIILSDDAWQLDAFYTQFVPVDKHDFNEADSDTHFSGVYLTAAPPECSTKYDAYLLRLERDDLAAGDMMIDDDRYTVGGRAFGTCPLTGLDMDVEGGYQFGDRGERDIEAWFVSVEAAHEFSDADMKPRIQVGYDYASGDDDPTDDKAETFNQLFPLGHAYLGSIDVIGRQNVQDTSLAFSFWPVEKKVMVKLAYHMFRRAVSEDALYNAGGGVVRSGDAGDSKDIGNEIDLTVVYKVSRTVKVTGGFSHLEAGDFIEESGASSDIDFGFVQAQYTF